MTMENPLKYFIRFENSIVGLLATVLEKDAFNSIELKYCQEKFWSGFAELCAPDKIDLSSRGPASVKMEQHRIDLLVAWDDWVILIEVKMEQKYVEEGQLQRYYNALRVSLKNRIAVIFITPTTTGLAGKEFARLSELRRGDEKAHLTWGNVLEKIRSSFNVEQTSSRESEDAFLQSLISFGTRRVEKMVADELATRGTSS